MNSTSSGVNTGFSELTEMTVYISIMTCAVIGNMFFLYSLIRYGRKTTSGKIIINLSLCDLILVLSSIPTHLIQMRSDDYPFGEFGCHIINPLGTMAVCSASLTLVLLAFERYIAICHPFEYYRVSKKCGLLILFCHIISLATCTPYSVFSRLEENDGISYCKDKMSLNGAKVYTIALFLLQYGIPLPIICLLYSFTWYHLQKTNNESIRRTRTLSNEISYMITGTSTHERTQTVLSSTSSGSRKSSAIRRWTVVSKPPKRSVDICTERRKQTFSMFRLFITIVIVFAACMLPNQITWLLITFSEQAISGVWQNIALWLTYTNSVLNPIIYSTNKSLQKYFKKKTLRAWRRLSSKRIPDRSHECAEIVLSNKHTYFILQRHDGYINSKT